MMTIQAVNSYYDEEISTTVTVVFTDLDTGIDEQVVFNPADDTYTILLNCRCSDEAISSAFQHARRHILNKDFEKDQVQRIEAYAHGITQIDDQSIMMHPDSNTDPDSPAVHEPEKPKRKQTREDDLSLEECHKRVQAEYEELYRQNMLAKMKRKRLDREKEYARQEKQRKEFEASMRRLGLTLEDRIVDDEYGFPVCRTSIVSGRDTVVGYWQPR